MNGIWQDELLQPYRIVCNEQTYGYLADIYHALKVIQTMRIQGFNDIYLYQDGDVFPLFSTDIDHDILNDRDVLDAREIVLYRIFQEAS
jgi:hypothetical protein